MNGPKRDLESVYVDPVIGNLMNHPQIGKINEIFRNSEKRYFIHLSEIFENNPLLYAKIEEIIFAKYKIFETSLLVVLRRQGKGILHDSLILPDLAKYRMDVAKVLLQECQKEARLAIRNAYYQNGYLIGETYSPEFTRLIDEANRREEQKKQVRLKERLFDSCLQNLFREQPVNLINRMTRQYMQR
ncbi:MULTISPECIES: hypothetical protein [Enterococcus]|uniref:hypothetical protein n=1 Tax=Enterococcus TaxID=1350 RepID=UPI000CF11C24|nr:MULTISPECIES: hypothetical protein [Enterococcus]PQD41511.1 hypothetical protein CUM72_01545 [Enterococcus durans]TKN13821.1 hypothetical protein DVW83_14285 [Enterococcus sp. VV15]